MNIGKLYQVKKLCWMLFPSKEIAATTAAAATAAAAASVATATAIAAYYSEKYNCNVSYIEPSIFCLLEKDGDFIKILSANGELGWINLWINLADWCKNDIEAVNQ